MMTTITYGDSIGNYSLLGDYYFGNLVATEDQQPREALYLFSGSTSSITLHGSGFTYSEEDGSLLTGTVTQIEFDNSDSLPLAIVETNVDAQEAFQTISTKGMTVFLNGLLSGKDTMNGSLVSDLLEAGKGSDTISGNYGDDQITGGKGNDRLTGGPGSDTFHFFKGDGKDVITDFDAKGADHDYIALTASDQHYTIEKSGHNTVIDFSDGDMITLLWVNPHSINAHDFSMPQ
jgi:Ca2+-binding RTX toxin-like protein